MAGANTNSITVDFGVNAVSGNVTVEGTNSCNSGPISPVFALTVNPLPTAAGNITGPANVCEGQTFVNFSVPVISYANTYNWTLPAGATIVAGNNTNSISVSFAVGASSGNITVQATNACGSGTISSNFALTVNPLPAAAGAVSGPASVCQGQTGVVYTVNAVANATGYNWMLPAGATIAAGANTNTVTVDFGANAVSGNITVAGTNSCGNGGWSASYPVMVTPTPGAAGVIGGNATVCAGQNGVNYFVNAIANAAGYNWTLPAGATIVSGNNTNSIIVNFSNNAVSGNIMVEGTSNCGNGIMSMLALTVNPLPAAAGAIMGLDTVCAGQTGVMYTVASITDATSYNWTWPTGVTVSGGNNMDTVIVDFGPGAMSGMITVEGVNSCGNGVSSTFGVIVNSPAPAGSIMGPLSTCQGQKGVMYSVSPINNATGYNWMLPAGATIAAGANTNVIWVDFAANASSGNVAVEGTNACGSGLSSSLFVNVNVAPTVTLNFTGKDTVCLDEWHQTGVALSGGAPAGGTYSGLGAVNGFFYPALAGVGMHVITYTYSDAMGCSNSATDSIYVAMCTGISNLSNQNNIVVFPNPTKASFTLNTTFAANENASIVLHNMFGEVVMVIEEGTVSGQYTKQVNIEALANGVYFLSVKTNGSSVTSKIIKN